MVSGWGGRRGWDGEERGSEGKVVWAPKPVLSASKFCFFLFFFFNVIQEDLVLAFGMDAGSRWPLGESREELCLFHL